MLEKQQEGRKSGRSLPPPTNEKTPAAHGGRTAAPSRTSHPDPGLPSPSGWREPAGPQQTPRSGERRERLATGAALLTPRASCGCQAGAAASPASLPLARLPGSIRITSWSKYAGQPENQSRPNQRLVNCNVAETHPSHPLLAPLSPPQPSAFRTIKHSITGERKI